MDAAPAPRRPGGEIENKMDMRGAFSNVELSSDDESAESHQRYVTDTLQWGSRFIYACRGRKIEESFKDREVFEPA